MSMTNIHASFVAERIFTFYNNKDIEKFYDELENFTKIHSNLPNECGRMYLDVEQALNENYEEYRESKI